MWCKHHPTTNGTTGTTGGTTARMEGSLGRERVHVREKAPFTLPVSSPFPFPSHLLLAWDSQPRRHYATVKLSIKNKCNCSILEAQWRAQPSIHSAHHTTLPLKSSVTPGGGVLSRECLAPSQLDGSRPLKLTQCHEEILNSIE